MAGSSSSLEAFGIGPSGVLSQATSLAGGVVGGAATALNPPMANVNSALAQVGSLTGGLLSTIMANVASALGAADSLVSNAQPTLAIEKAASNLLAEITTLTGDILPQATDVVNFLADNAGNVLSNANTLAPNVVPAATGPVENIAKAIFPTATAVIAKVVGNALPGVFKEVKEAGNTISHITTIVNGQSTVLPIVLAVLNGKPTAIPVVNMIANGAPTNIPVLNEAPGQPAKLLGDGGGLKQRRSNLEKLSYEAWLEEDDEGTR